MSKLGNESAYPQFGSCSHCSGTSKEPGADCECTRCEGAGSVLEGGLTKREYFAGRGAPSVPYVTDEELWFHFRNNSPDVLAAMRQYDAFHVQRDVRYADALLLELAEPT